MQKKIRQIFITGLAVTIPIGLTLYVFFFLIGVIDSLLNFLPQQYHPDTLLQIHIPGLGVIALIILIFISGIMMKSYFGNKLIRMSEGLFHKIPVIRSVYEGTKQIVDSMFVNKSRNFQKVVLVRFPHSGSYTLGFVTGLAQENIREKIGSTYVNVLVPTTPNPTSGYLIMVAEEDLLDVDMTVEEAFTYIISCGIVRGPASEISKKC
ncbi:MAG: DUF502 domain-containing protein [Syntrophales bacterium]|nr:DUF502 domain-containing protein [Syntrophales bacterium]